MAVPPGARRTPGLSPTQAAVMRSLETRIDSFVLDQWDRFSPILFPLWPDISLHLQTWLIVQYTQTIPPWGIVLVEKDDDPAVGYHLRLES